MPRQKKMLFTSGLFLTAALLLTNYLGGRRAIGFSVGNRKSLITRQLYNDEKGNGAVRGAASPEKRQHAE